jgi:hypothetical protein
MKRLKSAILGVGIIAGVLGFAPKLFADATSHLEKAAAYEQKATDLDAVIAEHKAMEKAGMTGKTPASTRQKMEKHCDAIIAATTKLQSEYRSFAAWHKLQANEEKGK